jgi:hypothetical protein
LAPNGPRFVGWGFGFGFAPAWPTESMEAITSITTTTSIDSPTNVVAFAVNTPERVDLHVFLLLFFLFLCRSGSGLTQSPAFLRTTSYLAFLGSHPLLFAGWGHAIRYYVWGPPNIHHGGHHATILIDVNDSSHQGTVLQHWS